MKFYASLLSVILLVSTFLETAQAETEPAKSQEQSDPLKTRPYSVAVSVVGLYPIVQAGIDMDYYLNDQEVLELSAVSFASVTQTKEGKKIVGRYKAYIWDETYLMSGLGYLEHTWRQHSDDFPSVEGNTQILSASSLATNFGVGTRRNFEQNRFVEIDWLEVSIPIVKLNTPSPIYRSGVSHGETINQPVEISGLRLKVGMNF